MTSNPALTVRRATERGHANHGWLDSWHSFSFADYYDPAHMGFRSLRVINDDKVAPKGGFPMHPHRDMEIFSFVLEGALAHEDSMGNKRVLHPGEIQLMRAGSGVRHSEFNPSASGRTHLLQIWITPATRGLEPAYTEWKPSADTPEAKTLVISPDGRDGSATIAQDAFIYLLRLDGSDTASHRSEDGRGLWLHLAKGAAEVNGIKLEAGDAISLEQPGEIRITATGGPAEALLFDLA
ncbi:MAG: pirin family protein [Verrucomicrobiaceae bacterium]|nr:MAG: pirin family protein [Verrucomicrobiaceae bacterium]